MLVQHPVLGYSVDPERGLVFRRDGQPFQFRDRDGYVRVHARRDDGKNTSYLAHRVIWEASNGREIPNGLCINHKNFVTSDNRIENLEVVTQGENLAHSRRAGRMVNPPVDGRWRPSLSAEQVREIKKMVGGGAGVAGVAAKFGVSASLVYMILGGHRYKEVA